MLAAVHRKNARRIDNRRPSGVTGDHPLIVVHAFVFVPVYTYRGKFLGLVKRVVDLGNSIFVFRKY